MKHILCLVALAVPFVAFADPAPNLKGMTLAEIEGDFGDAEFGQLVQEVESVQKMGTVLLQIPSPAADMGVDALIYLRVSKGLMVPEGMTGRNADTAIDDLKQKGFTIDRTDTHSDDIPNGTIVEVSPDEGEFIDASEQKIRVLVSLGPLAVSGETHVAVPNLIGLRLNQAIEKLAALGLTGHLEVGLDLRPIGSICTGTTTFTAEILSSNPQPGTTLSPGSVVSLKGRRIVSNSIPGDPCTLDGIPL